jgi:hypothetical protein
VSGWSLEGAWLQASPNIVLEDLWHGWEAVPFQNSKHQEFFIKPLKPYPDTNPKSPLSCAFLM